MFLAPVTEQWMVGYDLVAVRPILFTTLHNYKYPLIKVRLVHFQKLAVFLADYRRSAFVVVQESQVPERGPGSQFPHYVAAYFPRHGVLVLDLDQHTPGDYKVEAEADVALSP